MKAGTRYFRVVNLEKYQHYKHRNPPWIKLHASTLEDYDFGRLQDASKMHLCSIWLLASRTGNKIPYDAEWIAKKIDATSNVDLTSLQDAGFIELIGDASNTLATRKQSAAPERETETEGERENRGREEFPVVVEVPPKLLASVHSQTPPRVPAAKKNGSPRAASTETWEAFSNAYHHRYGVAPTRNKRVNSQIKQFTERVPLEEAPAIAAFYLTHNNAYYLRSSHSVASMLHDAEKLRTEWQTGRKVTNKRALQDEGTATNFDNAEEAKRILRRMDDDQKRKGSGHADTHSGSLRDGS